MELPQDLKDRIVKDAYENAEGQDEGQDYVSCGRVDALATAIQIYTTKGQLPRQWWVGLGGSWGETVFGTNPPVPSEDARRMANELLDRAIS